VLRYFAVPVNSDGRFWLKAPPGRYWLFAQPGTDDTRYESSKVRLPDGTATRSSLRQAAEQSKTEIEVKPCQEITFRRMNSMTRKNFLFVFAVVAFLSKCNLGSGSHKEKVVAGAERAFEKFTKAYVGPAPGCAAAVSLNGEWCSKRRSDLPIWSTTFRTHLKLFLSQAQSRSSSPPQRSYCCNRMESSVSTIRSGNTFPNCPITVRR
jgi:hypothetical protein